VRHEQQPPTSDDYADEKRADKGDGAGGVGV
jgi:hypothetical protein